MDVLRSSSIMEQGYGNVYKKVLKDKRLTQTAKLIHCYLCSYAGAGATAFPPVSLICQDLGIKDDTYYENLMCLKAYGYITVEQYRDDKGKFTNSVYTIELFPELKEDANIEKEWKAIIEKRKQRRKKWEEKYRTHSEQGTDKIDRTPSERDTVRPDTVRKGTNNNSNKNINIFIIWEDTKQALKNKIRIPSVYAEYIETLKPVALEEDNFILNVPSDWHKSIIEARYMSNVYMCFEEVCKNYNLSNIKIILRV